MLAMELWKLGMVRALLFLALLFISSGSEKTVMGAKPPNWTFIPTIYDVFSTTFRYPCISDSQRFNNIICTDESHCADVCREEGFVTGICDAGLIIQRCKCAKECPLKRVG